MTRTEIFAQFDRYAEQFELVEGNYAKQQFPLHYLTNYKLVLVYKGEVKYEFADETLNLSAGGILLINPFEAHAYQGVNLTGWTSKTLSIPIDFFSAPVGQMAKFKHGTINDSMLFDNLDSLLFTLKLATTQNVKLNQFYFEALAGLGHYFDFEFVSIKNRNPRLLPAFRLIGERLFDKLTVDELADACALSKSQFQRTFLKDAGITFSNFIRQERMLAGKFLLCKEQSVIDVAIKTGYYDQSHFHHEFKKMWGISPGKFKNAVTLQGS